METNIVSHSLNYTMENAIWKCFQTVAFEPKYKITAQILQYTYNDTVYGASSENKTKQIQEILCIYRSMEI